MDTDEQRATWVAESQARMANEREQVAEVFSLTGGELEDAAWHAEDRSVARDWTFTYWYQGVPDYVQSEYDAMPLSYAPTYRTVCRNEMFGDVPERVTDDEGTWLRVARYRTSGETECPGKNGSIPGIADERGLNIMETPCPLCGENPQSFHGHIYIGDGWAEIVYRLEPKPRTFVATFTLTSDADVSDIADMFNLKMGRVYGGDPDVTIWTRADFWKDVADGVVVRLCPECGNPPDADGYCTDAGCANVGKTI